MTWRGSHYKWLAVLEVRVRVMCGSPIASCVGPSGSRVPWATSTHQLTSCSGSQELQRGSPDIARIPSSCDDTPSLPLCMPQRKHVSHILQIQHHSQNKGQTTLAKGDIVLLSYLPGGSMRHIVYPCWFVLDPHFGRRGGSRRQRWYHSKERRWFPIRLSIVTIVPSITIRPQFAIKCLRCFN